MNPKERLLSKTKHNGKCIEFTGGISSTGYGVFWMNGRNENAHKAAYILLKGGVPNGLWVLHTCDNKKCVNPDHLYLGTRTDNTKDAVIRGRMAKGDKHGSKTHLRIFSGEHNPFSKISDKNCLAIKKAVDAGVSKVWLASQANVHLSTIYRANERATRLLRSHNLKK